MNFILWNERLTELELLIFTAFLFSRCARWVKPRVKQGFREKKVDGWTLKRRGETARNSLINVH